MLEEVAKKTAASIGVVKEGEENSTMGREFGWSETSEVDGEEMGSGLFFYFKKVDGKYRLFRLLVAG
ncbi:MAG: hypothetical protein GY811_10335 [Myxococcales bacterium]|nr:hypothetical protein [Myxococcales bacterium]